MKYFAVAIPLLFAAGCGEGHAAASDSTGTDSLARVRQDSINRAQPGYIVDSILPLDEQLRRFRAGLTEMPTEFSGGETSRDLLVKTFVRSLESADTSRLIKLTVSKAEFAYLVYPESPFTSAPYAQAPDLVWMRHSAASGTGFKRLLSRIAGLPRGFQSWHCSPEPQIEGANRIWRDCSVRFVSRSSDTTSLQLFAGIIERQGRYKILSYANAF